jgi:aminoglycoside N3'-acetyltransferase
MTSQPLTQSDILAGLRAFGVLEGAGVIVHSSLRSFGYVEGGARSVVAALMELVTPEGTLLMPSFNHNAPFDPGGAGVYDPRDTPTSNGAIPDLFWRLPGVLRSLDPTHPVAGWGKHARRYLENHHLTLTMGPESPLGLLGREGGYGLLLGVDFHANTYHHVVEMSTGAPCLGRRSEAYPVRMPDGQVVLGRTWGWREHSCPINDNASYAEEMFARGLVQERFIGPCRALLFRLSDCYMVDSVLLKIGNKAGALPCSRCPIRPRVVPQTVESD